MADRHGNKGSQDPRLDYAQARDRLALRDPWHDCRTNGARYVPPANRRDDLHGQCVWAAEIGGRLVGTIGLAPGGQHAARIQWLRVEPDWQHTAVLAKLIGKLYEHCCKQGYVRVVMDVGVAPQWIWRLLVRRGFRLLRRIRGPKSEVLEFALEPYPTA